MAHAAAPGRVITHLVSQLRHLRHVCVTLPDSAIGSAAAASSIGQYPREGNMSLDECSLTGDDKNGIIGRFTRAAHACGQAGSPV